MKSKLNVKFTQNANGSGRTFFHIERVEENGTFKRVLGDFFTDDEIYKLFKKTQKYLQTECASRVFFDD
jgi:hypothetical protein